jgi:hypothetical protein
MSNGAREKPDSLPEPPVVYIRGMILLLLLSSMLVQASAGALRFAAPPEWKSRQPASSMRVAEFTLPKAPGDAEDGELVVYYFGGTGGSVEANIERWIGQMQQPPGRTAKDAVRRTQRDVNGLQVTLVDISGTYVAEVRPGSADRYNKPNFRMRAAVVTTPKGPYFIKAVGPSQTMTRWNATVDTFVGSLRFER